MINKNLSNYQWVSINKMNIEDIRKVLGNIKINRYATGGVDSANKGILEIIGDGSFWNKFVFYDGEFRLGSITEGVLEDNEIQFGHMFDDKVNTDKL